MVKAKFDRGEGSLQATGSNFQIMIDTAVMIEEITRCILTDCPTDLKSSIVAMLKDSINYAIDEGAK
ncbi:MAG: hypothetical protein UIM53_05680 [Acutalibacteraceae bacterium]|nr:hypothetical protein [Acutalibacteraceae bacterium]